MTAFRRWFRFNLRTIFVAVLVIAAAAQTLEIIRLRRLIGILQRYIDVVSTDRGAYINKASELEAENAQLRAKELSVAPEGSPATRVGPAQ
jgi:hypothetical protein